MTIAIEEVDQTRIISALSDSGQSYFHICYEPIDSSSQEEKIWDASSTIRGDRMYLKIEKDYVSDYEGTIFLLTQSKESSDDKKYSEYDHDWVSEDNTVRITPDGQVTMNVAGVEQVQKISMTQGDWEQDLWFYYGEQVPESAKGFIWKTMAEIRDDILYLSVYEDNASDYQGKIIELKQADDASSERTAEK